MPEASRSTREMRRSVFILLALIAGFLVVGGSLINSLAFDLIQRGFQQARLPGCQIQGGDVAGSVLTGFLISDVKLLSEETGHEILAVEAAYLKLGLWDLLEGDVVIDYARISGVRTSSSEFRRLLALKEIQQAVTQSTENSLLGELKLLNVQFKGLEISEPLELFLSEEQLEAIDSRLVLLTAPVFDGNLGLEHGRFDLQAQLRSEVEEDSSIRLSMVLDARRLVGEALVEANGARVEELVSWQDQKVPGTLAMQARLAFSPRADELKAADPATIEVSAEDVLHYTLSGEARLLSTGMEMDGYSFEDIYLRTHWTHSNFFVSPFEFTFLGQRLTAEGQGGSEGYQASIEAQRVDLTEALQEAGVEDASNWIAGTTSLKANWDGQHFDFAPIQIADFTLLGLPARLEPFQLRLNEDFSLKLFSIGGKAAEGAILSPELNLKEGVLEFETAISEMELLQMGPLREPLQELGFRGRLDGRIQLQTPLRDPSQMQVRLQGQIERLEAFQLPADSMSVEALIRPTETLLSGELKLPLADGHFRYQAKVNEDQSQLSIESDRLDLGYLRYRFKEMGILGVLEDLKLDVHLKPHWEVGFSARAPELSYLSQKFDQARIFGNIKEDRFWLKFLDPSLRTSFHGTHELTFPADFARLQDLPGALLSAEVSLQETRLARLLPLGLGRFIHLDEGDLQADVSWSREKLELAVDSLRLKSKDTVMQLETQTRLIVGSQEESGRIELNLKKGGENLGGSLIFHSGPKSLGFELKDLNSASLQAFAPSSWPVQTDAALNARVDWKEPLAAGQSVEAVLVATDLNLNAWGKPMFVDEIRVEGGYRHELLRIDSLKVARNGARLYADLRLPLEAVLKSKSLYELPFQASVRAPGFRLEELKPLLPDRILKLNGEFEADIKLNNSLGSQLVSTGMARVDMEELSFLDAQQQPLDLQNFQLDARMMGEFMRVSSLSFRAYGYEADMHGTVKLLPEVPFELQGELFKPRLKSRWLELNDARVTDLTVSGALGRIHGHGKLSYRRAHIEHSELVLWLDEPRSPFEVPGFDDHLITLEVRPKEGESILQGDLFRFHMKPSFDVHLDRGGTLLDGSAHVIRGRLELATNRFEMDPSSVIRFVPRRPVFQLGTEREETRQHLLWEEDDFAIASIENKLGMLWNQEPKGLSLQSIQDASFDTFLRLRAISRESEDTMELSLNGPLQDLKPVLMKNGQPVSSDGVSGLQAMPGRSRPTDSSEQNLVSSQLRASVESQLISKRFEGLLRDAFGLSHVSLKSGLIQDPSREEETSSGFRLGTELSKDVEVFHEQERQGSSTVNRTQLELRLSPGTDLWFEQKKETWDFQSVFNEEEDVQFGIQRKWRF